MIHYHGGPITPDPCAIKAWKGGHAFISFAYPSQLGLAQEICQSYALDSGDFTAWKGGNTVDLDAYFQFVEDNRRHPGFDFAIIPDVIEGTEAENDDRLAQWQLPRHIGAAVWHTNESPERLVRLANEYPRIAIGSSGEYDVSNVRKFMTRMSEVIPLILAPDGYPICKIHGLRMLNPAIFTRLPLSSGDSTKIARNIGIDQAWTGSYQPKSKATRAIVLREGIEEYNSIGKFDAAEYDDSAIMQMF